MRKLVLPIEIESLDEGRFLAVCDASGLPAEGDTVGEALENIEDVATRDPRVEEEKGLLIPENSTISSSTPIKAQVVVTFPNDLRGTVRKLRRLGIEFQRKAEEAMRSGGSSTKRLPSYLTIPDAKSSRER